MKRLAGRLAVAGAAWLVLSPGISMAQPAEPSAKIASPDNASSITATNVDDGKSDQLREDLIKRELRHNYFRPYNPQLDNPIEGVFIQPSQPELTPEQAKKLKEIVDQQKYWMFASPDDSSESNTDDTMNDSDTTGDSGMSDFEKDEPKALKRFFDHAAGNSSSTDNTNSLHDGYAHSRDDAPDGAMDNEKINPVDRSAFASPNAGNGIIGQLFQSPASQGAIRDAGGTIGGNGLFSDEFSAPAQEDDRQARADEDKRRDAMNQILNSSPSDSRPSGAYSSVSGISAAPANNSAFGGLNTIDNGAASGALSAPSQEGISSSIGAASAAPVGVQPAPVSGMMQFTPIEPHQRSF